MILVDVYIPAIEQTVDFHLEETAQIRNLTEEVGEMIAQMTRSELKNPHDQLLLCDCGSKRILSLDRSLQECGIKDGSKLLLI